MTQKPSRAWITQHINDPYVQKAQVDGYRARSAYKLQEIQTRDRIFAPGMTVVDLGAAPGSWSQVAWKLMKEQGKIIAIDILPMDPLPYVDFLCGDFREATVLETLTQKLAGEKADVIISDMSPNLSGNPSIDQPRAMYLAELALAFVQDHLKPKGGFVMKAFQGQEFDQFLNELRATFHSVTIRKPKASRDASREVYLVAKLLRNRKT